jgi:hypothetical protein
MEVGMTNDEIVNALDGLAVMLKLHTQKLMDTFTQVHQLDQYNPNKKLDFPAEFPG